MLTCDSIVKECLSVRMEHLGSYQTDFNEILYFKNFRKSSEEIQVSLKSERINSTLHENHYTFSIVSRSFLLRMINGSDKSCRETQNIYFVFIKFFFENRAVYEKKWKNLVEQGRPPKALWHMRIACSIPIATDTHTQVV